MGETEWEREMDRESKGRRSYREEISKDDSNFLMDSPEATEAIDWYEEDGNRNYGSSGVKRRGSGQGYQ